MHSTPVRYTATAIVLHWLSATLIVVAFAIGLYMSDLQLSPAKLRIYAYHKWLGVTLFLLVAVRIGWRASHPAPPLPAAMPAWQRSAAHWSHLLLYLLMVAVPLSGWLMSSALGFQTVYLGLLPIPDLLAKDKVLGELLQSVHEALNWSLAALVAAHAGAALKHRFVDQDGILSRMLPLGENRSGDADAQP